jgi:hypothetical protein
MLLLMEYVTINSKHICPVLLIEHVTKGRFTIGTRRYAS